MNPLIHGEAIGQSPAFLEFQERLSRAAKVNRPILLIGERGTGKELAAGRVHYLSPRWDAPLLTLNCAALNPNLIESELFGHEAGAFTGALRTKPGRFEKAAGGSLFLDEIGLVPLEAQEKILRVVEYGEYERVGGVQTLEADVRIIGATSADLPELCARGRFKEDLLDRLSFEVLFLPPLRERKEDILLLAGHFAARMAREIKTAAPAFSKNALDLLLEYPWPGNIRELKNVVERAVYRCEGAEIAELTLSPFTNPFAAAPPADAPPNAEAPPQAPSPEETWNLEEARQRLETGFLRRALEKTRHNQKQAAALLGLSYDSFRGLYRKLAKELKR
ncbi:MAG: phage shock protein operon transcriptional activator [Spirochaetia bacterium]|jgi:psp operon transcriptional activator|nr:phage shock protein operon transcriptional activator [Spirochaetia bacterium]